MREETRIQAARQRVYHMTGAQIREMMQRFEDEREAFEAQIPALKREADKRGKAFVSLCESRALNIEGLPPITYWQTLGYRFERLPTVPKSERAECGARTRKGGQCRARVCLKPNGQPARRCRLHGGLSSGPKSSEGRARIAEANRRRAKSANLGFTDVEEAVSSTSRVQGV